MEEPTNIKDVTQLLQNVTAIRNKYDEINRLTGADYNIFNVLKLRSDEVRLHSRFISDLLNPKGKHGRGEVFLKLFLEQVKDVLSDVIAKSKNSDESGNNKEENSDSKLPESILQAKNVISDFNISNAIVIVEEYIGKVKPDEGGRIDLIVKDGNKTIVIENKIYANDQNQQLIRYYNRYSDALIIYLTLRGKEASQISVTSKEKNKDDEKTILKTDVDYFRISYKDNIYKWLEECLPHTTQFPFLRESISQYLNIVKQLTGQSMNKEKDNEIIKKMFTSIDSIKSSKEIAKLFDNAKKELYNTFRTELQNELNRLLKNEKIHYCLNKSFKNNKPEEIKTQYFFKNCKEFPQKGTEKENKFKDKLVFEFSRMYKDGALQKSFYYGFRFDNSKNNELIDEIKKENEKILNELTNIPDSKVNDDKKHYWQAIKYYKLDNNRIRIDSCEFMVSLNKEDERNKIVNKLAKDMLDVIKICIKTL